MRITFWVLLVANLVVLLLNLERNASSSINGREPGRLANQLNADKIQLLPAKSEQPAVMPKTESSSEPPQAFVPAPACVELAGLSAADAKLAEQRLAGLNLGDRLSAQPTQEISSYVVLIPSFETKEDADNRVAELQQSGVTDLYVFPANSSLRYAISLGVFKVEEAARTQLTALQKKGVKDAQIAERKVNTGKVALRLRNLDQGNQDALNKIQVSLPPHVTRKCS